MLIFHCPGCGREIPVSEHELGAIFITCAGCETRFAPQPPPPDEFVPAVPAFAQREWTGLRCHRCGERIYEGDLARREARVGRSFWWGGYGGRGGYGEAGWYGRVNFCLDCAEAHDRADAAWRRMMLVILALAVGLFLVVFCGGILVSVASRVP